MSTVNKALRPYFDDYEADKDYYEVLFRPSVAVQTRELNQIQSMFHEQIGRLGNHTFKEGSMVIPGETSYDLDLNYITLTLENYDAVVDQLVPEEVLVVSPTTGISAKVKLIEFPENGDPLSFYLEYLNASTNGEESRFSPGEGVQLATQQQQLIDIGVVLNEGVASKFTINDGVYYINKRFVLVREETVILDKYSNKPSKIVAIEYNEVVVTENEDGTLFDNAFGTTNFTAPGAHRIRVDTKLRVFDLDEQDNLPSNVVEIFRITNGEIQKRQIGSDYNILGDVLAQRTYEQSGNYTVRSFPISFDDLDSDDTKYLLNLGKGLAYVNGYRVESFSTLPIETDRARERAIINNSSISANLGYYIVVNDLNVLPDVSQLQEITFYDAVNTVPGTPPAGANVLGTARIRFIRSEGAGAYRFYLFNVRDTNENITTAFISQALSIHSSVGANAVSANLVESTLFNPIDNSLIFPLSVNFVASLNNELGQSDTSFTTVKQYSTSTDGNGRVTISAAPNENFVQQDPTFALACFLDDGTFMSVEGNYSLSGTPLGSVITVDFGSGNSGRPVRLNLQVAKQEVQQKVKTPSIGTFTGTLTNGQLKLAKADAYELISVKDSNDEDITNLFTLHPNKTASMYDISYVSTNATIVGDITVTFRYFAHSSGDYFGVDSYSSIPYEDIPVEGGTRLSDVLDFRPRINDAGTGFTGVGAIVGNIPTPFSIIRTDVDHYLARRDKVYVDTKGGFGVKKGVPSLNPTLPEDPSNAMVLYELYIPPYTFNVSDIQARKINNRRYTMRDIGRLEDRLANVEYYVSLNFLEQEAESKEIIDPVTGLNRFKNGFLTDAFVDHSVGDFSWDGYHVSVADEGELRPEFSLNAVDLEINELNSTNVVVNDGIVTLPYVEKSFIRQNKRSSTINVNPYAVYRWTGNIILTPHIDTWIDNYYTDPDVTYQVYNNGRLTQTWKSWQVNWTGSTTTSTSTTRKDQQSRGGVIRTTTTTTTTTRTNVDVVADKIIDTSVIPYMRSIDVEIFGMGHRPRSRAHFFFDGVNVNQYVRPQGNPNFGTPVICNEDGIFTAVFRIPNNNTLRFRTGDKILAVTDEPNNDIQRATSYSEATFTSSGVLNTRQRTIIATRQINTSTTTSVRNIQRDPIAQSFVVERDGGVFVTKINVFFSTKSDTTPIQLELREMNNGVPTQRIIPGGVAMLNPADVNVSSDGSVPTTFKFPHPVHLLDNNEYCFVLVSNSNMYHAHIAVLGELDTETNTYITEQPHSGVMFKSQNNSTWTEDQNADIQFEIFVAEFDTNVVGTLVLENKDLEKLQLNSNPISTTSGSSLVTIKRYMHNYVVGSLVEIEGALGGNGISDAALNKAHKVVSIDDPYSFTIDVNEEATETGVIGGPDVYVSNTIQASVLNPNIRCVELPGTGIEYWAQGTSGKSIDGLETPYTKMNYYQSVTNSEVNEINFPWLVTNAADEAENLNNNKSLSLNVLLATSNPNISPVIDLEGSNIIMPFALITNPEDKKLDGSNNFANYRTIVSGLKNPANALRVYFDAVRPDGSDLILSARFGNSSDEIETADWIELDAIVEDITGDLNEFRENEYSIEEVNDFTLYQLMIQMKSQSAVFYPIVKNLRVIALGT